MWRLRRRPRIETYEDERVSARVVLARVEAAIDRLDAVWDRYYSPVADPRQSKPNRREGT